MATLVVIRMYSYKMLVFSQFRAQFMCEICIKIFNKSENRGIAWKSRGAWCLGRCWETMDIEIQERFKIMYLAIFYWYMLKSVSLFIKFQILNNCLNHWICFFCHWGKAVSVVSRALWNFVSQDSNFVTQIEV